MPEQASAPEKCDHAWASKHEPGHRLYWVRQCMLCHEVDWDDLDTEIGKLIDRGRLGTMTAEQIARAFHETYIRLAPGSGMVPVPPAIPWDALPFPDQVLMVAVVQELLDGGVILGVQSQQRPDEDRIREAMAEAQDHPGRVITR